MYAVEKRFIIEYNVQKGKYCVVAKCMIRVSHSFPNAVDRDRTKETSVCVDRYSVCLNIKVIIVAKHETVL